MTGARVLTVNLGQLETWEWKGRTLRTAFNKRPVDGLVQALTYGLEGDGRGYEPARTDPDHAVYAYASEDTAWWSAELGLTGADALGPGAFGENLTVAGVDVTGARVGDRWHVGEAVLEVAKPREPCSKLAARFADTALPRRYLAAGRPGAYLRVIQPGAITAGDAIRIEAAGADAPTIGAVFAADAADA